MGDGWERLAEWWRREVADDPAYAQQVVPLVLRLLTPRAGARYLDLGCGEGQVMRGVTATGAAVIGCDVNVDLLAGARRAGPVVRCRLPDLGWVRPASCDGGYLSLVLEHLDDVSGVMAAAGEAIRRDGVLVAVLNHPLFTAPGSAPVLDLEDGEVLWRWGSYLQAGTVEQPTGGDSVRFRHRPLSTLLNAAADAGWVLERLEEQGLRSEEPALAVQQHLPRLLGVRWRRS